MTDGRKLMSDAKFYEGYARYLESEKRYETWDEAVERVIKMHREYYKDKLTPELDALINEAEIAYKNQEVLGAQRALQFGGEQLLKNHAKIYNCSGAFADRVQFFRELMFMMLSGAGVGFSVQKKHTNKLPDIARRKKSSKEFIVPDSIEGWSDAINVLVSSFFTDGGDESYRGRKIYFDLSKIRPKGSEISGGFIAPGPEPLMKALNMIEFVFKNALDDNRNRLKPIEVYDIAMFCADAVISGGVRRAATICLFSPDDEEMMTSKTGNWYITNPQRRRANNSVVLVRDNINKEQFFNIMNHVKQYGEPGFLIVNNEDMVVNPCAEIGFYPILPETGETGFMVCNLTEINGIKSVDRESFLRQCRASAILGTLQAGYTNFDYLSDVSKNLIERESLLGCSITGWMNNPDVLFDEDLLKEGATVIKELNEIISKIIGINPAARLTTVKPSGNSSTILGTTSGIHGEHSPMYFRHVQFNRETEVAKLFIENIPEMVEEVPDSQDICVAFPIKSPENSLYKSELQGIEHLKRVKFAQQHWIMNGHVPERCLHPKVTHNVSNTCTVDNWDEVTDYLFENKDSFCGVSFLAETGDKTYYQAPFAEVLTHEEIVKKYGQVALFTSALIEVGQNAFNNNLWRACDTALGRGEKIDVESSTNVLKREFVRRFKKFAKNFSSEEECANCLKDLYYLHKWWKIENSIHDIDWSELNQKKFVDIDTLAAQACSGGACEIQF